MKKHYEPQNIEAHWLTTWDDLAIAKPSGQGSPYCIMLPPPNVTGTLHKGHGFQQSLMDTLIRYHRMCGRRTLWQPGTDHAGIATQMVVERQLAQQNLDRHTLGREAFVERIWQWKQQSGGTIKSQMKRLGVSPDWSREKFTLDDSMSEAVRHAFVRLHREGLIYRGQRLVNWDPVFETAISDLEVINETKPGHLWHMRYPLADSEDSLVVATTRPETMLGDTAVAVHPEDERYQHLIGQQVRLPISQRLVPIIADDAVDRDFGTGCVKITPAHDFNDYAMAQRHQLPMINIMTSTAHLNDQVPERYRGLERMAARQVVIDELKASDLLVKTEPHTLSLPIGDRSKAVIEPLLTDQWFVHMAPLAEPALAAVENGDIRFIPDNWRNTYNQWLVNIEDWCISRQLWWGHRIPAWYDDQGKVYVGMSEAEVRAEHQLDDRVNLRQDDDVLDTWFSSALWPFATLGWPEKTADLDDFLPTSCLVTGFDIIFFWVARMIMMSLHLVGKTPFRDIYITGLVRDQQGQKMSKSKGNVIDPVDLIDGISLEDLVAKRTQGLMQPDQAAAIAKSTQRDFPNGIAAHGTDALRFTYCALAASGRNICFDMDRLAGYRNFCNKLWNAARFVLQNIAEDAPPPKLDPQTMTPVDRWLQGQLDETVIECRCQLENYRFDLFCKKIHHFVWEDYCDWYLECAKIALRDPKRAGQTQAMLLHTLDHICRLLHPVIPFITEEIWQHVKSILRLSTPCLAQSDYPSVSGHNCDQYHSHQQDMAWMQSVVNAIRQLRSQIGISPQKRIAVIVALSPEDKNKELEHERWQRWSPWLMGLAQIEKTTWTTTDTQDIPPSATAVVERLTLYIPLAGLVDPQAECDRLNKQITKLTHEQTQLTKRLANPSFVDGAPAAVVQKCRDRQRIIQEELDQLHPRYREMTKLL